MHLESLSVGLIALVAGVPMIVFPRRRRLAAEERRAQLDSGAPERYFEERRTLDAYPLPPTDSKWRIRGVILSTLGLASLAMAFLR